MNESLPEKLKKIISFLSLRNAIIDVDEAGRRIGVTTDEDEWFDRHVPELVSELKYLATLMARKTGEPSFVIDINNYRKEREKLILDIAKAAAQKVLVTKAEVRLPAMNAYERRLVHVELAMRPDVKTESAGEGKDRCVVIRPI
jgi:spoIIIJ-associated protein